ncbi:ParB/RepB/Spo0J family partition protein [Kitasatospora sp. NBC_00240]|uniref:ParB/RepB/Spo0J family partition protein n=1 Tax=Kitasatospora sp. NBC_00240 TaxID=2903567 RepID=UPI002254D00E|nr:ParB/RepB/Spo0J family partition protein [Kitasatospora sp. NBC_00240]MCX5216132.1 ParB/RepB/Spo0J family partition protein [Kitasatospora sp. NBC_00240]
MSVADRLGAGSSFGSARTRSARGRAKAVTQGDVPEYELVRLRLPEVSPTPLNPRRNFGTDEELTRFGEELRTVQLAACVAVTRTAYLALWPEHEDRIGAADWVLVNGERRYRSAVHVGLEAMDFVVRDDLASTRENFVDHLLKENLEREDFDVIERARGVQQLVEVCSEEYDKGARARAAERLGKDRSWITNQLALLRLPEQIQAMLSSGEMPERDGRLLARHCKDHPELDSTDLIAHLKDVRAQEAAERQEERALLQEAKERRGAGDVLSADNTPASAAHQVSEAKAPTLVLSADNTNVGEAGALEAQRSAVAVLSADNTETTDVPEQRAPARPGVLSADNTGTTDTASRRSSFTELAARALVHQLGATIDEQAKTLAAGMNSDELESLISALHEYL